MTKILITYLLLFTSLIFGQDPGSMDSIKSTKILFKLDSVDNENRTLKDTSNLSFDKNELVLPIDHNNLTKVVMVKEKTKVDWLKYLLPIITLFLGIWVKTILEKRSDRKNTKKSGERWIAELQSLEEPIKEQIKSLKNFLEEHEKEEFKIPRLQIFSSLSGEVFKSMGKNDLIKFIELNNKKKKFEEIVKISNRTNGYVSILVHLHETLQEKFKKYLSGTSTHTTSLSLSLQSFNSAFRDYGIELEKELGSDPYNDPRYRPIADLYSAQIIPYLQGGDFNPFVLEREFFIPLVGILAGLRLDPRTKELASVMTAGLNAIKGIQLEKGYMSENIKTVLEHYEEQLEELEKVINNIKKH